MVAQEGRYYGNLFKIHRGVTQMYPLSHTILNTVVGALILHLVTLVAGEEVVMDGFGPEIQWLEKLFYSDDGLLDFPSLFRLEEALYVLTGLIDRVDLHTNVKKQWGWYARPVTWPVGTQRRSTQ